MNELDYLILAVIGISVLVGLWRGVISEVLGIVGWVAGVILAIAYAGELAGRIPFESLGELTRVIIAAVVILVVCLLVVGIAGRLIRLLMEAAKLTFEDRLLGGAFGALRGVVIVCAVIFFFGLSNSIATSQTWKSSTLIQPMESVIDWSMPYMPRWLQTMREDARPKTFGDKVKDTVDDIAESTKGLVDKTGEGIDSFKEGFEKARRDVESTFSGKDAKAPVNAPAAN